jgi:leucyl/phenylalanyl-tRNA--protein transferase
MFSFQPDASKVALAALAEYLLAHDVALIDCQVTSSHLQSLGAREVPRAEFLHRLTAALAFPTNREAWHAPVTGQPP